MKDFMLIFIGTNYEAMDLSPEEAEQRMNKWWTWQQKMQAAGQVKNGNALHNHGKNVTGPNRIVSDKSSAELKELVGGYYIVTAKDYDEAVEIAQDYPDYDLGGKVEIREVIVFEQLDTL